MNRKKIIFSVTVIAFACLVLYILAINDKSYYAGKYPKKIENAVYYTDERAQAMFVDERNYSLTNLKGHEVYLIDDTMHIDFYFDKNATFHQIDKARSFAITAFILKQSSFYGESPYMMLNNGENRDKWEKVSCKVYINDKLNIEENYNEKGLLIKGEDI